MTLRLQARYCHTATHNGGSRPHGYGFTSLCAARGEFFLYKRVFPSVLGDILVSFLPQFSLLYFLLLGLKFLLVGGETFCVDGSDLLVVRMS